MQYYFFLYVQWPNKRIGGSALGRRTYIFRIHCCVSTTYLFKKERNSSSPPLSAMNSDQTALYERAGELARRYHESKRRQDEEQSPAMPRGLFSTAIHTGFNETSFRPQSSPNPRVASFANRMGMLARVTQIWKDKKALVKSLLSFCSLKLMIEHCEGASSP